MTKADRRLWAACKGVANNKIPGSRSFCQRMKQRGLARYFATGFGNDYYTLTKDGVKAYYGA